MKSLMKNGEIDHYYTSEIVCPHCGYVHHDSWEWGEDGEDECGECEERFSYRRIVTIEYSTEKPEPPSGGRNED
jgi:hypothetical protein